MSIVLAEDSHYIGDNVLSDKMRKIISCIVLLCFVSLIFATSDSNIERALLLSLEKNQDGYYYPVKPYSSSFSICSLGENCTQSICERYKYSENVSMVGFSMIDCINCNVTRSHNQSGYIQALLFNDTYHGFKTVGPQYECYNCPFILCDYSCYTTYTYGIVPDWCVDS